MRRSYEIYQTTQWWLSTTVAHFQGIRCRTAQSLAPPLPSVPVALISSVVEWHCLVTGAQHDFVICLAQRVTYLKS